MADKTKKTGTWLSRTFNSFAKHLFSPTMIFMMVAMALPAVSVAASAAGAGATLGDIGLATVDMYVEMIKAPFTDGGVVVDAVVNAADGNIAAESYEMGMMDHGNGHANASDHTDHLTRDSGIEDVLDKMSGEEVNQAIQMSKGLGVPLSEYLLSM